MKRALLVIGLTGFIAACSEPPPSSVLRASDFGEKWPLTVEEGTLKCLGTSSRVNDIVFIAGDTTYAVNGEAKVTSRREQRGWKNIEEIWKALPGGAETQGRVDISPIFQIARGLCAQKASSA
ncbi:MAG: DUF2511 domain-containing protein [Pseudomonas sp.]